MEKSKASKTRKLTFRASAYTDEFGLIEKKGVRMLYPEVELIKEHAICTCGAPNFRNVNEFHKPLYKIYKVTIPQCPYGTVTHHLCEECIKRIVNQAGEKLKFKGETANE